MPEINLALLLGAAFIVGMSKGGLASAGSLAVPLLAIWLDPLTAAALLLPIFIVSDAFGVWLYRREYSPRNLAILIPAGLLGVAVATVIEPHVPEAAFTLATGLIGLWYCLRAWAGRKAAAAPKPARLGPGVLWGAMTGMVSFISHSGAPPFQAYVLPQQLPKMVFAGTTTITFAAINLSKLPAYYALGLFQSFNIPLTLALCATAIAGTWAGRRLSIALPDRIYLRVIMIILFLLSLRLTQDGAMQLLG